MLPQSPTTFSKMLGGSWLHGSIQLWFDGLHFSPCHFVLRGTSDAEDVRWRLAGMPSSRKGPPMLANCKSVRLSSPIVILMCGLSCPVASAANLNCDLSQYQPLPGLMANAETDQLVVHWDGESDQK